MKIMSRNNSKSQEALKDKLTEKHFSILQELEEMYGHPLGERKSPLIYCAPGITYKDGEITGLAICNIDYLPKYVFKMTSLVEMDIAIKMDSIPPEISQLKNLERLSITLSELKEIPDSIGELTKLTELDLHQNNNLRYIPSSIGKLTLLKKLNVGLNKIKSLPKSFKNLSSLEYLDLSSNLFITLPNDIGELTSLQTLDLRQNKLITIPDSIGNLHNLKVLDLSHNEFENLPYTIGKLNSLEELNIIYGKLRSLPESIGKLNNLKILKLWRHNLYDLPETIGNLESLKILELTGNNLTTLPSSIGNLVNLEELNLWNNNLETLPDSLGNLKSLKSLQLEGNNLRKLPETLINLSLSEGLIWSENPLSKNNKILRNLAAKGVPMFPSTLRESDRPFDDIAMTKGQIREFLKRLAGPEACQFGLLEWKCGGKDFEFSRKILNSMEIPNDVQNKLLNLCKELGGYCDCEILMNAAQGLLGEETPW